MCSIECVQPEALRYCLKDFWYGAYVVSACYDGFSVSTRTYIKLEYSAN